MRENENLQVYYTERMEHMKLLGRSTNLREPVTLFTSASGVEINSDGSELWVLLEADYEIFEPWIAIYVNGALISRRMVMSGKHWMCIYRMMNPEKIKNVKIVRELQAMPDDENCCLQVCAFKSDGSFHPVREKKYRFEFVGDSMTSGEGTYGAQGEEEWLPMYFSTSHTYPYMVSEAMDADYHVISQSGWGLLYGYDNDPKKAIPKYYHKICGALEGAQNEALGAWQEFDFSVWTADVVVINLGTNDANALDMPPFTDEDGNVYDFRRNQAGGLELEDAKKFVEAVEAFLAKVRTCHPFAHIIWAYGTLGTELMPYIQKGVSNYQQKREDARVSVLSLPRITEDKEGSRFHPGVEAHKEIAELIINEIREHIE